MRRLHALWRALKGLLLDDLALKLLALTVAVGLFLHEQHQSGVVQQALPVPVVARLPPASARVKLMSTVPGTVLLTVRGPARTLGELLRDGLRPVEVDLTDGKTTDLVFSASMFQLPPNVELVQVEQPPVELDWQPIVTRSVPVHTQVTGEPQEGFEVSGTPAASPTSVVLEGPASLVELVQAAEAVPFDVTGLRAGDYRRLLALAAPPPRTQFLGPSRVEAAVQIRRRAVEREFTRPVEVTGVPHGRSLPHVVKVLVTGPPEVVDALTPEQLVPGAEVPSSPASAVHGSAVVDVETPVDGATATTQPPRVTVRW